MKYLLILFIVFISLNTVNGVKFKIKIDNDFGVIDFNGVQHKLINYNGKVVLLAFWASWYAPCIRALTNLYKITRYFNNKIITFVVGIGKKNIDKAVIQSRGFKFTVMASLDVNMPLNFKFYTIPFFVLLNKNNKIVWTGNNVPPLYIIKNTLKWIIKNW